MYGESRLSPEKVDFLQGKPYCGYDAFTCRICFIPVLIHTITLVMIRLTIYWFLWLYINIMSISHLSSPFLYGGISIRCSFSKYLPIKPPQASRKDSRSMICSICVQSFHASFRRLRDSYLNYLCIYLIHSTPGSCCRGLEIVSINLRFKYLNVICS